MTNISFETLFKAINWALEKYSRFMRKQLQFSSLPVSVGNGSEIWSLQMTLQTKKRVCPIDFLEKRQPEASTTFSGICSVRYELSRESVLGDGFYFKLHRKFGLQSKEIVSQRFIACAWQCYNSQLKTCCCFYA